MEKFLIKLLVNKNKVGIQYFEGDIVEGYIENYGKIMRIKKHSMFALEPHEYEILIDDRDYNQLLYCV